MAEQEEPELTPERLREWELHIDHLERATAEVERLSQAAVAGFREHYRRPG